MAELALEKQSQVELPPTRKQRLKGLDTLRGLAALTVMLYHFTWIYDAYFVFTEKPFLSVKYGPPAVSLFFMISGFVILMTAERVSGVIEFAISRFLRLFPTYWVCLLISFLLLNSIGVAGYRASVGRLMVNITMLQGFVGVGNIDGVYWSLGVELCFYIWIAGVVYLRKLDQLWVVMAALMVVGTVWQLLSPAPAVSADYRSTSVRIAELVFLSRFIHFFAAGTALYYLYIGRRPLGYAMLTACGIYALLRVGWNELALGAVFVIAIAWMVRRPPQWLISAPFLFMGKISFALYLIHTYLGWITIREVSKTALGTNGAVVVAAVVSIAAAAAITFWVEQPILKRSSEIKRWIGIR